MPGRSSRKFLSYGETFLVPQAGIKPTPHTDTAYRPVMPERVRQAKPLGHHLPQNEMHWYVFQ